jgi:hypothetical protein
MRDGNEWEGMKNPSHSVVAATFEKTKAYAFAVTQVWDREVGGSNPLAPTIFLRTKHSQRRVFSLLCRFPCKGFKKNR